MKFHALGVGYASLPPERLATHSPISRIAPLEQIPDPEIKDIVDIIEKGLRIFAALGGG